MKDNPFTFTPIQALAAQSRAVDRILKAVDDIDPAIVCSACIEVVAKAYAVSRAQKPPVNQFRAQAVQMLDGALDQALQAAFKRDLARKAGQ